MDEFEMHNLSTLLYETDMKNIISRQRTLAKEEVMEEARKRAAAELEKQRRALTFSYAKRMKRMNIAFGQIAAITGLSFKKIRAL